MSELEQLRNEIEEELPLLGLQELGDVCTAITLPIPDPVKGNKVKLYRHVLTQLWSEADKEDQGFATYNIVHKYLEDQRLSTEKKSAEESDVEKKSAVETAATEVKVETELKTISKKKGVSSPAKQRLVEVQKFQTLKFTGVIGGEKNNISFDDLNSQINNARKVGYTDAIICGAITKALCPSNVLRQYFETVDDLEVESMLDVLQPYFKQTTKNSGTYYTELCNAKQRSPDKSAMDFAVRIFGLKNRIVSLSEEEGALFPQKMLFRQLHKTLYGGIKNLNIRAEVRDGLKSFSLLKPSSDYEYFQVIAEAMSNEETRQIKFNTKEVDCNLVENEYDDAEDDSVSKPVRKATKNKENLLPARVDKQKQEIKELKADFKELRAENSELKDLLLQNNRLLSAQAQVNSLNLNPQGQQSGFSASAAPFNPSSMPPMNFGRGQYQGGNRGFGHRGRGNNNQGGGTRRPSRKCPSCHENKVEQCRHCWFCGRDDHRLMDCPDIGVDQGNG